MQMEKMSPFTSLIIIPVIFGVLAGYGFLNTLSYAMDGIKSVASTFAMMLFAILYFGILLQAGLFDPIRRVKRRERLFRHLRRI